MYKRLLIPLDGSKGSEDALPHGAALARSFDATVHLLLAVSPQEMVKRGVREVEAYLGSTAERLRGQGVRVKTEARGGSLPEVILDTIEARGIDLVVMCTPAQGGIARLTQGNVTEQVVRKSGLPVIALRVPYSAAAGPPLRRLPARKEGRADAGTPMPRHVLREVDILRDLSPEQIDRVAALGQPLTIPSGWVLGDAGHAGDHLFIIISGQALLSAPSAIGEVTVRIVGPGESFPLATLVGSGTLITSATAMSDMRLLAIPRAQLVALLSKNTEIGMKMYHSMAEVLANRYRNTLTHLTESVGMVLHEAGFWANM